MNHEHMNVNDEVEQIGPEQTKPKKPWVTPRLDDLDREGTNNGGGDFDDATGSSYGGGGS